MQLLNEPPSGSVSICPPPTEKSFTVFETPGSTKVFSVLSRWEGEVLAQDGNLIYALLLRNTQSGPQEQERTFSIHDFQLGAAIEVGSTFAAEQLQDSIGRIRWRNRPYTPTHVTSEKFEKWEQQVANFEGSNL